MILTNKRAKRSIRLFITGFFMGTADLIPGVSGGTIAYLSGIYEELIHSIKHVTGESLKLILQRKFRAAIKSIPFAFLVPLAVGLFTAILTLANLLTYLLREFPVFIWSFFFGLVLTSALIVMKRVVKWNTRDRVAFIGAAVGAYILVGFTPVETPYTLLMFFLSGAIAICAMILPGISGSFILLLLGKYQQLLMAVTQRDILTLGVFMAGCILGIALFSRILSWLFKNHHDISVAILSGFMLGSARKIWPWKEVVSTRINSHGLEVPLIERNIMPATIDTTVLLACLLAGLAVFLVYKLDKLQLVNEFKKDVMKDKSKK